MEVEGAVEVEGCSLGLMGWRWRLRLRGCSLRLRGCRWRLRGCSLGLGGCSLRLRGCRRRLKGYSLALRSGCEGWISQHSHK